MIMTPNCCMTSCITYYKLRLMLIQLIPSFLLDLLMKLKGDKPMWVKKYRKLLQEYQIPIHFSFMDTQRKIQIGLNQVKFFYYKQIKYKSENFRSLDNELLKREKEEFSIEKSMRPNHDMIEYMYDSMIKHWIKQTDSETQKAKRRFKIFGVFKFMFSSISCIVIFYYLFVFATHLVDFFVEN